MLPAGPPERAEYLPTQWAKYQAGRMPDARPHDNTKSQVIGVSYVSPYQQANDWHHTPGGRPAAEMCGFCWDVIVQRCTANSTRTAAVPLFLSVLARWI